MGADPNKEDSGFGSLPNWFKATCYSKIQLIAKSFGTDPEHVVACGTEAGEEWQYAENAIP